MLTTKRCDMCRGDYDRKSFGYNCRNPDGLHTTCKSCKKILDKKYQEGNRAKIKARRHEYYLKNKETISKKTGTYSVANRVKCRVWVTRAKNKIKTEVFAHYSGGEIKCRCGQDDLVLLTIDHINGGGNKHRKEINLKKSGGAGYNFYCWLKRNGYPDGFQVLCWNCNFKKRLQEMAPKNPDKKQLQSKAYARSVKIQCLEQYGGVCPCGEQDKDVLTLDHVNDDGASHRRETNTRGFNFYIHLRKNGFPQDPPLKVLCLCCQYKKRGKYDGKEEEGEGRQAIDREVAALAL